MSTEERYGGDVWRGFLAASVDAYNRGDEYVPVGEISCHAGVSLPTTRKYMRKLTNSGDVGYSQIGKNVYFKRYPVGE